VFISNDADRRKKMKLYHATNSNNIDSINVSGIAPNNTDDGRCNAELSDMTGVYGFTDIESAHDFAGDQGWGGDYAVYSFDAEDIISDPEYDDDSAMFYATDDNVCASCECVISW
jgi:hypothetical protein